MKPLPGKLKLLQNSFLALINDGKLINLGFQAEGNRTAHAQWVLRGVSGAEVESFQQALADNFMVSPDDVARGAYPPTMPDMDSVQIPNYTILRLETNQVPLLRDFTDNLQEALAPSLEAHPRTAVLHYLHTLPPDVVNTLAFVMQYTDSEITSGAVKDAFKNIREAAESDIGAYTKDATAATLREEARVLRQMREDITNVLDGPHARHLSGIESYFPAVDKLLDHMQRYMTQGTEPGRASPSL